MIQEGAILEKVCPQVSTIELDELEPFLKARMDDITRALQDIEITEDNSWFMEFLVSMDKIRNNSKKIGNAQRMYFKYFFRELFNKDGDSYANLADAAINAYQKYDSQVN